MQLHVRWIFWAGLADELIVVDLANENGSCLRLLIVPL